MCTASWRLIHTGAWCWWGLHVDYCVNWTQRSLLTTSAVQAVSSAIQRRLWEWADLTARFSVRYEMLFLMEVFISSVESGNVFTFVGLWTKLLETLWTDFDEICWVDEASARDDFLGWIQFCIWINFFPTFSTWRDRAFLDIKYDFLKSCDECSWNLFWIRTWDQFSETVHRHCFH